MTTPLVFRLWVYLHTQPLLWLTLTLAAYAAGAALHARAGRHPLLNPVLVAASLLVALLLFTGTDYATYFSGAQFVHFLLGPATVALAVPMARNLPQIRRAALPLLAALGAGSLTAIISAVAIGRALGVDRESLLSLAPKSVTTPIAMAVAERIGGLPSLAAVFVILTGIAGAALAGPLLNLIGVHDKRARGFATGLAAHGIGTARAFQESELAGVFAGIAIGMNGVFTAVVVPQLAALFRIR